MPRSVWCLFLLQLMAMTKLSKGVCQNMHFLPVFGGEGLGDYCEKTLHNLNCSVGFRKDIEKDTTLECKIKREKGWEEYMKTLGNLTRCSLCEPSQLVSLRVVRITQRDYLDEEYSYPIIELNFTVPKPTVSRLFYPGGISLTFSSNRQAMTDDYEFETRYRLLDFSKYKYSSPDSNSNYQRSLSFPCFMGYRHDPCQSDDYKVYSVSFKSFSKFKTYLQETAFTELTYNVTVYSFYVYHPHLWKSTIAVAFFPGDKDVIFLFDPVPDSVTFQMYNISLVDAYHNKSLRNELILKGQATKHGFRDVEDGVYHILIEVITTDYKCPESCRFTRSHSFTVGNPKPVQVRVERNKYLVENSEMITIIMGTFSGILLSLLLFLGILSHRRRKNHIEIKETEKRPLLNGVLIYSNNNRDTYTLACELKTFCLEELKIYISLLRPQNDMVQRDNEAWFKETLANAKIVIIFWTPEINGKQHDYDITSGDFDTCVKLALNPKYDDKKLACIYFKRSHEATIPSDIQKAARVFYFPENFSYFCSYIYEEKTRRNHKITIALKDACFEFSRNNRTSETAMDGKTLHNKIISNGKMDIEDTEDLMESEPLMEGDITPSTTKDKRRTSSNFKTESQKDQEVIELKKTPVSIYPNSSISSSVQEQSPTTSKKSIERPAMQNGPPSGSVSTDQLFDNSCESHYSSSLSISRLQFKTMTRLLQDYDQSSYSSYEHCEHISTLSSSSTNEYECIHSPCCLKPNQNLFFDTGTYRKNPQDLVCEVANPSISECSVKSDNIQDTGLSKCPVHALRFTEDTTSECFCDLHNVESYSVNSESIRSSEIDLSEFIHS